METSELARKAIAFFGTYFLHSTLFLGAAWVLWKSGILRTPRSSERVLRLALCGGLLTAALQLMLGMDPVLGRFHVGLETAEEQIAEDVDDHADADDHDHALRSLPSDPLTEDSKAQGLGAGGADRTNDRDRDRKRVDRERERDRPGVDRDRSREVPPLASLLNAPDSVTSLPRPTPARPSWKLPASLGPLLRALAVALPLAALTWIALTWIGVRHKLGRRRVLREGPLFDQLQELRARARLRYRVRLSVSERLASPVSFGFFRREIAVPSRALLDLSAAESEGMLAHELAHAKRRDALWFQLYFLIERCFFLQPLNRFARRHLIDTAELLCDDQAVRWTGSRLGLASCLTTVAEWHIARRERALPLAGMAASRSNLSERVERLLDDRQSPTPEGRARLALPLSLGALSLVTWVAPSAAGHAALPATPLPENDAAAGPALPTTEERLPVVLVEPVVPARQDFDLDGARASMQQEFVALEGEFTALADELRGRDVNPNLVRAVAEVEARVLQLRHDGERLDALLERLRSRTILNANGPTASNSAQ